MPIPPQPERYRSPHNLLELFGAEDRDAQATADMAEGMAVGLIACDTILAAIKSDHGHRGKAFMAGIIEGIRDNL